MGPVIRWTVGDVSSRGFDALALLIAGAQNVFAEKARYLVCVNTIPADIARERVGHLGSGVKWRDCTFAPPGWLREWFDPALAEGVAWKFAPLRICPGDRVLSLDNDVILWRLPDSIRDWLEDGDSFLIAEDVRACHGRFAHLCPREPRNSGMVGFPPHFDPEPRLRELLEKAGVRLSCETDEQGLLQVALVTSHTHRVVRASEVSISGYYRPHMHEPGSCGAHFVGVNVKDLS